MTLPLARWPLVGRVREQALLRDRFASACQGASSLVLIAGEPGIGKTALCEDLASHAIAGGSEVLVGHCRERGASGLPYLPVVEALQAFSNRHASGVVRALLGPWAATVTPLLAAFRDGHATPPHHPGDPEADRWQLLQGVTAFLRVIATDHPLVLILEDLHDADQGTLDLLLHLVRTLGVSRTSDAEGGTPQLLVVGTYRDVEVDRTHPLSTVLAELRRTPSVARVRLRGLSEEETGQVTAAIAGMPIPAPLAQALQEQTDGNPLFVQEMARYLVESGALSEGQLRRTILPEGLRDVLGKRLSRLSDACNQLLRTAAVIGRTFDLDVLLAVAERDEEAVLDTLEPAIRAGLVEEREQRGGVAYRFTHALVRQALSDELRAPLRIRLHRQTARALERCRADRLADYAADLAEHYEHASDPGDLAKALLYGTQAAQQAMAVYAYGDADRLLERALEVQDRLDPEDRTARCDLLLVRGQALAAAGRWRPLLDEVATPAFALAEALADSDRAGQACTYAVQGLIGLGTALALGTAEAALWAERSDRHAPAHTLARVRADLLWASAHGARLESTPAAAYVTRALDLARRLDDPAALWAAAMHYLSYLQAPQRDATRLQLATEFATRSRAGVSAYVLGNGLYQLFGAFLSAGRRTEAEAMLEETWALVERSGNTYARLLATNDHIVLLTLDGQLVEAAAVGERLLDAGGTFATSGRALLHLGDPAAARLATGPIHRAVTFAHLGRREEVETLLQQWVLERPGLGTPEDETSVWADALFLEAAVVIQHQAVVRMLLPRVQQTSCVTVGYLYPTCIARHLSGAAALLGDHAAAREYAEQALRVATALRFRPEVALARLQLAELLLLHAPTEGQAVREHLTEAIAELRAMGMQPALTRAEAVQAGLRTPPSSTAAPSPPYLAGLTPREVEVLRMLAAGATSREIAATLVLSVRTVDRHTANLYAKLGARNKADAVAYAVRHGLADADASG